MDFITHLRKYLSKEEVNNLEASLALPRTHALLLNTKKMAVKTLLRLYPLLTPHPIVKNGFYYDKNIYDLGRSIYHELGCFYLQEPSAMVVSYLLNPLPDETVLDLCAAPGGKSVQASFLMRNQGAIIANDISRSRCRAILENVERLGLGNIIITNNDFALIANRYLNYFDKIIVDAPCSGSGMFRKDERLKDDWSYQKVLKYAAVQKELLALAFSMLKPGGTLVYATCSFSYEENEEVVATLLNNSEAEFITLCHPAFYQDQNLPLGVHLFPHRFKGEGHYLCLIKKKGLARHIKRTTNQSPLPFKVVTNGYTFFSRYGDFLFLQDKAIKLRGLNIIRNGVKV
ncbi:MAG: RsmB/NOP family class I SAM-dependent RNA methyltransferase, partial [Erysipelotrichia bacterium]|nr:RsmB/NOP family class I SAM-dependent RNA methyltransferase [Erysipelotrichia bacterium]